MKANSIINDSMSLQEKLEAIDKAMAEALEEQKRQSLGTYQIPVDPADLTMCLSCQ